MSTPEKPKFDLSGTQVDRIAEAVAKRTRPARATETAMAAFNDVSAKHPLIVAIFQSLVGAAFMLGGYFRMERHRHGTPTDYIHLGSDWLVIAIGIACIPGLAAQVGRGLESFGRGLGALVRALALWKKNGNGHGRAP